MTSSGLTSQEVPKPKSKLESLCQHLIALEEGLPDEEITLEHTRRVRQEKIDPVTRYCRGSAYGGYSSEGLIFLTLNEYKQVESSIDKIMAVLL